MDFYAVKYSWENSDDYLFLSGVYSSVISAKVAMANGIEILHLDEVSDGLVGEIIKLNNGLLAVVAETLNSNETTVIGLYSTVKQAMAEFLTYTEYDDVITFGIKKQEYVQPMKFFIIPQQIDEPFIQPTNLY